MAESMPSELLGELADVEPYEELSFDPNNLFEPHKSPRDDVQGQPRVKFSQRLDRYVEVGKCILCGGDHRRAECDLKKLPEGKTKHRRHISGRITVQKKSQRLIRWILAHWSEEELRTGGGVLDIAGGQGRVATELHLRYRIECTVIDPRGIVFVDKQLRYLDFQLQHPDQFPPGTPSLPKQKQILFEDDFLDNEENRSLWENCRLVIGLHPDEATERIVRFCLRDGKDFVVLPCCVFPNKFPDRLMPDGSPVKFYPELCEYLKGLDLDVEEDVLDIPGRNIILYKKHSLRK